MSTFLIPYLFFILLSLWVFYSFKYGIYVSNKKETLPMYTKTHFYSKTADHINAAAAARMEWNYWKNNKIKTVALTRNHNVKNNKCKKEGLCCFICLQHTTLKRGASEIYSQYIAFLYFFFFNKINKKNFSFFSPFSKKETKQKFIIYHVPSSFCFSAPCLIAL